MTSQTLTFIRTSTFAVGGLVCLGYALALAIGWSGMPQWLPIATGAWVAVTFFVSAFVAGPKAIAASLDESYHQDRLVAGHAGFWTALGCGTLLWLAGWEAGRTLGITLTLSCSAFFLTHVIREIRGHL